MRRDIAVGAQQIGYFYRKIALMLAIATERANDRLAGITVIAFDKLVFGVGDGRFDILIRWASAR